MERERVLRLEGIADPDPKEQHVQEGLEGRKAGRNKGGWYRAWTTSLRPPEARRIRTRR